MRKRSRRGQSLVEYGIGIGCVTAVCMCVLAGLGHASADIINTVLKNINDVDDQTADPGYAVNLKGTPWVPQ